MSKEIVYINNTLAKDEEIKWIAHLHWLTWVGPVLWLILSFVLLASQIYLIGIFICFIAFGIFLGWENTEYVVTNKRVIAKRGIIAVKTEELRNQKVVFFILDKIYKKVSLL